MARPQRCTRSTGKPYRTLVTSGATRRQLLKAGGALFALAHWNQASLLAMPLAAATPLRALPKALWVWKTPLSELGDVAAFAREWGIQTLFYSIPPQERDLRIATPHLRALKDAGLEIIALAGDARMVEQSPATLPLAIRWLFELQSHSGVFSGLQVDVEPHSLPAWKGSDRTRLAVLYEAFLERLSKASRSAGLPLSAALHFSYAKMPSPSRRQDTLLQSCLANLDEAALMAYRRETEPALHIAKPAIEQFRQWGKPWWFGVTTQNGPEAELISHYGQSQAQFAANLSGLFQQLGNTGCKGIAIQHYQSLRNILPSGKDSKTKPI